MCGTLGKACEHIAVNDAVHLARVGNIVRREKVKMKQDSNGSFDVYWQESMPVSLLALVCMALSGPNIRTQSSTVIISQLTLMLLQLLMYNSVMYWREVTTVRRP